MYIGLYIYIAQFLVQRQAHRLCSSWGLDNLVLVQEALGFTKGCESGGATSTAGPRAAGCPAPLPRFFGRRALK
jgi:hypothetical protein